jgi:hypothetical protein
MDNPEDLSYPAPRALDFEKYLPYLDEFDISKEQKIELLKTLWNMMGTFVDIGWGVDSAQNASPAMKAHVKSVQRNETSG